MVVKHKSSKSRWVCAVDEISEMDHFFAYIKSRMICAIDINILNLKPFDFFVSDDPSFINSADLPTF